MHWVVRAHTHLLSKSKVSDSHVNHSQLQYFNQHWDDCRMLKVNSPGKRIATHSQGMVCDMQLEERNLAVDVLITNMWCESHLEFETFTLDVI